MLRHLLQLERAAILADCEEKVLHFGGALAAHPPAKGWAIFYDDLVEALDKPLEFTANALQPHAFRSPSTREFVAHGYTIADVVQSYAIITRSIAKLAEQSRYVLSPDENARLNLCVASVIADAAAAIERETNATRDYQESQRLGSLAHELRNSLQAATVSLEMIGTGSVGANSNTSDALQQSLQRMGQLIDTTLTEVRMRVEPEVKLVDVLLIDVISQVATTAGFVARTRGISLVIQGHYDLVVHADRQLLLSALSNIVQNALKYSGESTTVRIHASRKESIVRIEVSDQCGGLPPGAAERMFTPFTQYSADRTGVGLGLSISYNAIKKCHGEISVKDIPGVGCMFSVELPAGKTESLGLFGAPR
jgi:signal transduction histidine kinase